MPGTLNRIISIAFAVIVLLNTMGYYGIFLGLHYQNDVAMTRALDSGIYDRSNAIILKVPVAIPYMTDQSNFTRVNGQVEHDGELYRIVKQRYSKDTLTVVCVRDTEHKRIDVALSNYVKTFTDKASDPKSHSKLSISFIKDYLPISFAIRTSAEGWTLRVLHDFNYGNLIPTYCTSIVHPPERTGWDAV